MKICVILYVNVNAITWQILLAKFFVELFYTII